MLDLLPAAKNGFYSLCTAHPTVLRTACHKAAEEGSRLLVESTSNQVDQFGGYTGMTPLQFVSYIRQMAQEEGLDRNQLILGGDHLGPNRWQNEKADQAMEKAATLVKSYVQAGYHKIHLDTSMPCADDEKNSAGLPGVGLVARRSAELCRIAETCSIGKQRPWYVIGTDVPPPGGSRDTISQLRITPVDEVEETITLTRQAFEDLGLQEAWERVIAVVVQPGVEFGDESVAAYDRKKATPLINFIKKKHTLAYEAHSTDYQTKQALKQMISDRFSILKVGPWLTYAYREVMFALAIMEKEIWASRKTVTLSGLIETIERRMIADPVHWRYHYHGSKGELSLKRKYSYLDRLRYYWPDPEISASLERLMKNYSALKIPEGLLSQYLPLQYEAVVQGKCANSAPDLIEHGIGRVLDIYDFAVSKRRGE